MKINEIYKGDCLELMPKFVESKSVDMIFCDLPYGTTQNKWDSVIPLDRLWSEYKRIIKDNGVIVLTAAQPFTSTLVMSNPKMFKYEWIWKKTKCSGHLNAKKMPLRQHESVLIFYKKPPTYNPQGLIDGDFNNSRPAQGSGIVKNYGKERYTKQISKKGNYPKTIQEFANPSGAGHLHPTMKPLSLIEYMILTYTNEGDLVLDNTCGSGTTGLGAKNLERNFIMMEQDPEHYEAACKRVLT
ncbi:MAG: site-specific DNA-methyltransferase [Mesoflavibacter sp.]|nr:site-specific DNA-methyltransferase [Mesoflavibacter sp.]